MSFLQSHPQWFLLCWSYFKKKALRNPITAVTEVWMLENLFILASLLHNKIPFRHQSFTFSNAVDLCSFPPVCPWKPPLGWSFRGFTSACNQCVTYKPQDNRHQEAADSQAHVSRKTRSSQVSISRHSALTAFGTRHCSFCIIWKRQINITSPVEKGYH